MIEGRVFLKPWMHDELKDRDQREERMLDLDNNSVVWERQSKVFEHFKAVEYAKGEQKLVWDLPGHGKAGSDCGEIKAKGCDNVAEHDHGKVFGRYYKRSCRGKRCPTCFEAWASAEGERALIRLATYVAGSSRVNKLILEAKKIFKAEPRSIFHKSLVFWLEEAIKEFSKNHSQPLKPIHVVLSPPPGLIDDSIKGFRKGRDLSYRIARSSGLIGGAAVFHPYRENCSLCKVAIPDYEKTCPSCGGSSFVWVFSPHIHTVGFGWISHTAEGYEKHGWVVKNLGVRKSIFATFQYLLSHAGVSDLHTTTWFGKLAYNMMESVPILGSIREVCPYCGRVLLPLKWVGFEDHPPPTYSDLNPYENEFLGELSEWRVFFE